MRVVALVVLVVLSVLLPGCSSTVHGSQMQFLVAAQPTGTIQGRPGSGFGTALAVDEQLAVVGAFLEGPSRAGAAYVYRRSNGEWALEARFESANPLEDGFFGSSVAIGGGWVAIGARNEGAIYLYRYTAEGWELADRLQPSDSFASNRFGAGLALNGKWLAFNGKVDNRQTGQPSEVVFLYARTDGPFELHHVIPSKSDQAGSFFGGSIALALDTIAVGASNQGPTSRSSGAVYLYDLSMDTPVLTRELTAPRGLVAHAFGASLALSRDLLAVGSPGEDYGGYRSGPIVLFGRNGEAWDAISTLLPNTLSGDDRFGTDLALVGDDLLVAGYTDNDLPSGSTYISHYQRTAGSWVEVASRVTPTPSASARFIRIESDGATLLISGAVAEDVSRVESFQLTRSPR